MHREQGDQLPKGKWYTSFDDVERLWEDADRGHWVPRVRAYSDGAFAFGLGSFGSVWNDEYAFFCFCDA